MRLLTHERTAVGSELLAISPRRARSYARVLAGFGGLPAGWNPAGEHGAAAGWDLVLVEPRTLGVLRYDMVGRALAGLRRGRSGLAEAADLFERHQQLATAHHRTVEVLVRRLAVAAHIPPPPLVDHPLDSAHQPLLHTHVVFGALTEGGRRLPLDAGRLRVLAGRTIIDHQRRLRDATAGPVAPDCWWGPVGPDGNAELAGLPARLLAAHSGRCRPLSEITACARAVGDL
jgi:hypothetical protein